MIETNKIIVFPHLRGRIAEKAVNSLNVAIQDLAAEQPDDYIHGGYENINNELNNIISNIHGESQLIELYIKEEKVSDKKHLSKSIDAIKHNCLKLIKISNNMMDLKIIEEKQICLNVNNVNIVEMIEDIVVNVSNIIKDKKIIFDTNIEEKFITCDVAKIRKTILILLYNAIKFSGEKEVFIKLHIFENNIKITISFINKNKKILDFLINKMDNLNKNSIKDLSVSFHLCKSFIKLHGGHIDLYGNGEEIAFLVKLPCENTDSVYYLYTDDKLHNNEYLKEQIHIEFSDLYEI